VGIVLTHATRITWARARPFWPRLRAPAMPRAFAASVLRRKLIGEAGLVYTCPVTEIPLWRQVPLAPFDLELITMTLPSSNRMRSRSAPSSHGVPYRPGTGRSIPSRCALI